MSARSKGRPADEVPSRRRGRRAGRRGADSSGSTLVEFALLLPVFSLMLFGMVQFGLAFYGWDAVHNGVQAGARLASIGYPSQYTSDGSTCTYNGPPNVFDDVTVPAEFSMAVANGGPTDATTGAIYCQVLATIGDPAGANVSGTDPAEVNLTVDNLTNDAQLVTVCARVEAQTFTGFFPNIGLSSSSQFYVDQPSGAATYAPYGETSCPSSPQLALQPPTSVGATIADTVQLTGVGAQPGAQGQLIFWVYDSGNGTDAPASCDTSGSNWTQVSVVPTTGDGTYASGSSGALAAGNYWWYATYTSTGGNVTGNSGCGSAMVESTVGP